jgi:hypothetical protein
MIQARKQNTTTYPIVFLLVDSNDHVTGKTGLGATPTITISKNGGSFGPASGTVSELVDGWYVLSGNVSDRDTLGSLGIHVEATGTDPCDLLVLIVKYDPFDYISIIGGNGGDKTLTYTLTDSGTASPVFGATIELYATEGMTSIIDSQTTNVLGQVTFSNLIAGTYYLKCIKSGFVTTTDTEVVA